MNRPCIAFKMNYCNGGKDEDHIGFYGICSDAVIEYNILNNKNRDIWCRRTECPCRQYLEGKISGYDLDSQWEPEVNGDFVCYESAALRDWFAGAGSIFKKDVKKWVPRTIKDGEKGHLCILTTVRPNMPEYDRVVFAMFRIGNIFRGNKRRPGKIFADDYWRLEFRPREVHMMNFWDFYQNNDASKLWGSGLLRYFDDVLAVKFLERAVEVKRGTPEEDFAKEFLKQYPYK